MTDNILEVETNALAHFACVTRDSVILLTDFACAYLSVNHSWIFQVLEEAELPRFIQQFLRMIYNTCVTDVEFVGKTNRFPRPRTFARVRPKRSVIVLGSLWKVVMVLLESSEHKFQIAEVLKNRGWHTGVTGDGVYDALALKKVNVGVAADGATDAAQGAAAFSHCGSH